MPAIEPSLPTTGLDYVLICLPQPSEQPTPQQCTQPAEDENGVCPYPLGMGTEWTVTEEDARDSGGRLKVERVPYAAVGSLINDKSASSSSAWQQPHQQQRRPEQQAMKLKAVEIHLPPDTNDATQRLVQGIILRTITPAEVQQLIRQGADAAVYVELRECRRRVALLLCVSLLSLAIDDWSTPTALEEELTIGPERHKGEFILPLWPSREVQAAILPALIEAIGWLRINSFPETWKVSRYFSIESKGPIEMAVRAGNLTAVKTLVVNGAVLRGRGWLWGRRTLVELPRLVRSSQQYEEALLAIYTYLVKHDRSLAISATVLDSAAETGPIYSRGFTFAYLQLMKDNGATVTPYMLIPASWTWSYHVIEWLCQHLSPADINATTDRMGMDASTPLYSVAVKLMSRVQAISGLTDGHGHEMSQSNHGSTAIANERDQTAYNMYTSDRDEAIGHPRGQPPSLHTPPPNGTHTDPHHHQHAIAIRAISVRYISVRFISVCNARRELRSHSHPAIPFIQTDTEVNHSEHCIHMKWS